jgi:plastocyanin
MYLGLLAWVGVPLGVPTLIRKRIVSMRMSSRRHSIAAATTTIAALFTAVGMPPATQASAHTPDSIVDPSQALIAQETIASDQAAVATVQKAARAAGASPDDVWITPGGTITVNVTTRAAARDLRATGTQARVVEHTAGELNRIHHHLQQHLTIPGTAYAINPATNKVEITTDNTLTDTDRADVDRIAARYGNVVTIDHIDNTLTAMSAGGDGAYPAGQNCSLGFNVQKDGAYYFLTAGHCSEGERGTIWYSGAERQQVLGTEEAGSFPDNDYALVRYQDTPTDTTGVVTNMDGTTTDITTAGTPAVGQAVSASGAVGGLNNGTVTALDVTVNYVHRDGNPVQLNGLIQTDVCSEPGDSGGPLFAGSTAYGTLSSATGYCSNAADQDISYYQPVTEALDAYGVTVY